MAESQPEPEPEPQSEPPQPEPEPRPDTNAQPEPPSTSGVRPGTSESAPVSHPSTPFPDSPGRSRSPRGKVGRRAHSPYGRVSPRRGSKGSSRSRSNSPRRRMLQTPNAFLHARNERKTVEMDLQLMANRLARLQAEEAKAVKKVEAMRRKAGEIVEQKQRNLQKYQMKYQHVSAEFEALQQQAAQQAYLRQQHRENLKAAKEMVLREKRDNAMGIRQASQENEWLAAKFKQEDVQRNRMSRDFIRSRQREFHARKQEYKDYVAKHLDEDTGARIVEEKRALQNSLRGIEAMAAEEKNLIRNLKSLEVQQVETSKTLEASLAYDPFAAAAAEAAEEAAAEPAPV